MNFIMTKCHRSTFLVSCPLSESADVRRALVCAGLDFRDYHLGARGTQSDWLSLCSWAFLGNMFFPLSEHALDLLLYFLFKLRMMDFFLEFLDFIV